jgi:group I intron endonuclease
MKLENFQFFFQPGIYVIKNIINNKLYYGQSNNLALRLAQHYRELTANAHETKSLQKDWSTLGASAFKWSVLEIGEQWLEKDRRVHKETVLIFSHKE